MRTYEEHETDLTVRSVTDEHGTPRPYTTDANGDFLSVIMAVPEGQYVHGAQTYVIEYTQRDVTFAPVDASGEPSGIDEFYWDVNGTDWSQPFGRVSARVVLDDELAEVFTGAAVCYRGRFGSGDPCPLSIDGGALSATEYELGPYENVTIALGFPPGTFSERPAPLLDRVPFLLWGGFAALVAAIGHLVIRLVTGARGARTHRAIIAQYEPPEGIPVAVSAALVKAAPKSMTATLLDLAVRRRIRLLRHDESDQYGVQQLDLTGIAPMEQTLCTTLFSTASGETLWFSSAGTRVGDAAVTLRARASNELKRLGLIGKPRAGTLWLNAGLFAAALILPILHTVLTGRWELMIVLLVIGINAIVWLLLLTSGVLTMQRPRTMAGALLHDHLMGLREYIRLAEADRIRMLQSASGVEVGEDLIVRVYERLLPYAVIFGLEKEWQAELAKYYRETTPEWVFGSTSHSFSHALPLTGFQNYVASRPVTREVSSSGSGSGSSFSSFSSSSSGSSGGGFSGGGGGGGGGRGI